LYRSYCQRWGIDQLLAAFAYGCGIAATGKRGGSVLPLGIRQAVAIGLYYYSIHCFL
jgi:hypothetical protein